MRNLPEVTPLFFLPGIFFDWSGFYRHKDTKIAYRKQKLRKKDKPPTSYEISDLTLALRTFLIQKMAIEPT